MPESVQPDQQINILNANAWLIPGLTPDFSPRLEKLITYIKQSNPKPPLISLTEVWSKEAVETLRMALPEYDIHVPNYTHASKNAPGKLLSWWQSKMMKFHHSGLVALTLKESNLSARIEDSIFHPFPKEVIAKLDEQEAGKGVFLLPTNINGREFLLALSHFTAYETVEELTHQVHQFEILLELCRTHANGRDVIVAGDFNIPDFVNRVQQLGTLTLHSVNGSSVNVLPDELIIHESDDKNSISPKNRYQARENILKRISKVLKLLGLGSDISEIKPALLDLVFLIKGNQAEQVHIEFIVDMLEAEQQFSDHFPMSAVISFQTIEPITEG